MDYKKYEDFIKSNKNEIEKIKNDTTLSDKEKEDRVKYLEEQNKIVQSVLDSIKKLNDDSKKIKNDSKLSKKEKNEKLRKIKNEIKDNKLKINKLSQGKLRDVFSSLIFNADKIIHNVIYKDSGKEESKKNFIDKLRDKLWSLKEKRVNKRYDSVGKYLIKNGLVAFGVLTIGTAIGYIAPIVAIATGAFVAQTGVKAAVTAFNKIRYGGPKLERNYNIPKGGWLSNIKSALFKFRKKKNLTEIIEETLVDSNVDVAENENKNTDDLNNYIAKVRGFDLNNTNVNDYENIFNEAKRINRELLPDDVKKKLSDMYVRCEALKNTPADNTLNNLVEEIRNFDLDNASLDDCNNIIHKAMPFRDKLPKEAIDRLREIWNKTQNLTNDDEKVITETDNKGNPDKPKEDEKPITKKPNIDDYANIGMYGRLDSDDKNFSTAISIIRNPNSTEEEKEEAYSRLAMSFGSGKSRKEIKAELIEKLNDFNKSEHELAELGRKLRNGSATKQDKNRYMELLYHFGKQEEVEDYIADEAARYAEDVRKFDENNGRTR